MGLALMMYAEDHEDSFPRSQHSAFANRQLPWGYALLPYLGTPIDAEKNSEASHVTQGVYRCPSEKSTNRWHYAMNVYFELGDHDDYRGHPLTWRRTDNLKRPSDTVFFGEVDSAVDHIMAHFWTVDSRFEVKTNRHGDRFLSNYAFADGHCESLKLEQTYDPFRQLDKWHPEGWKGN